MENIQWDLIDIQRLRRWARQLGIEKDFEINVRHEIDKYSEEELFGEGIIIHLFESDAAQRQWPPDLAAFWRVAEPYWTKRRAYEKHPNPDTGKVMDTAARELNRFLAELSSEWEPWRR